MPLAAVDDLGEQEGLACSDEHAAAGDADAGVPPGDLAGDAGQGDHDHRDVPERRGLPRTDLIRAPLLAIGY